MIIHPDYRVYCTKCSLTYQLRNGSYNSRGTLIIILVLYEFQITYYIDININCLYSMSYPGNYLALNNYIPVTLIVAIKLFHPYFKVVPS